LVSLYSTLSSVFVHIENALLPACCFSWELLLFWVVMQLVLVIHYRRFGTSFRSHRKGTRIQKRELSVSSLDPWRWDR